ncbi:hypothetical protein FF2_035888 [Malus domestica]
MFDVLLQVLLRDVGAGKSSLVLRFVKEQFVEFQTDVATVENATKTKLSSRRRFGSTRTTPKPLLTISCQFPAHSDLDLPCILSQVLRGEAHLKFIGRTREEADSNGMVNVKEKDAKSKASEFLLRRKAIHTANKAVQRYERNADYCFLHDCVSDIFAQCFKSNIENFHHHKDHDHDHHDDYCLEITQVATLCLPPLIILCYSKTLQGRAEYKREQLAAANEIDPSDAALLPHDILSYIKYPELEQEADVKWKKMVEVYSKQGKLKNWLVV